jgi:glycosyltransferase involved in cell wall biosynthesis
MRIAYLSTDPGIPYGGVKGASVHVAAITEALAAEGNDVLALVAGVAHSASPPPGVFVEVLPGPGKRATAWERLEAQDALADWLERRLADVGTHALYERLALHSSLGVTVAERLGIPHLVELNAPLLEEAARYRRLDKPEIAERLESETLRRADLVFAVSPPLAAYARARGAARVEVLQNAVAMERFPATECDGASPVAVFVGSLRPWHGIETIAEAWTLLGRSAPRLLVVGAGPSMELLRGLAATMTGPVPPKRVPSLLATAAIGLAPYSGDAPRYFSPLKLFEYLAAGLATIVADLPAVTAVVDDDTALVIPPGDSQALAHAVAALCKDPSKRRRLGENGRALVAAGHTWRHRARRILAAVTELAPARAEARA